MMALLTTARGAAAAAAAVLRRDYLVDAGVTEDQAKDIKTLADVAAQAVILDALAATGIPVVAEEERAGQAGSAGRGQVWYVDPLDGTLNFTRGFAMAAVSVALWRDDEPLLGVVHDVFHGTVYAGVVGSGAWCNETPMRVSAVAGKDKAILATGFPSGRSYDTASLLGFVQSVQTYKKVRMLGSAALMLAQVAAGRFDAYEEEDIYLWDVAAGLALVRAAGGAMRMTPGSGPFQYRVRADNGRL
jgi:myo-inositol-1(or 4)-monophosphatase